MEKTMTPNEIKIIMEHRKERMRRLNEAMNYALHEVSLIIYMLGFTAVGGACGFGVSVMLFSSNVPLVTAVFTGSFVAAISGYVVSMFTTLAYSNIVKKR